ncbi:hypothetical protein [Brumimicrobium mesophilum]|uniref:hypothetical protein n=1 Tax=Brumimicrobium mesophilum TaxID=392717 RepID=UPI000D141E7E|nr:hypothetical protein [Brumimicrobium mesophilum]
MKKLIFTLATSAFLFSCGPTESLEDLKDEKIKVIKEDTYLSDSIQMSYLDRITECKTKECIETTADEHADKSTKAFALAMIEEENKKSSWEYNSTIDEMTSDSSFFAKIASDNFANLEFPYGGLNYASLMIRNVNGENSIVFAIDKGQFSTDYNVSTWMVRFDDREPLKYSIQESASGNSTVRFLTPVKSFIENVKNSDSMKIQVSFFQEGNFTYKFKTLDLKWEH